MEVPSFEDYFWGEKNNGFYVLYHNMKYGYDSSKDFTDFLRESCTIEENYAKLLTKLAKYISNSGSKGSFSLFWQLLKSLAEKLSSLHMQLVHSWQELIKDVQKYTEEQHKLHKSVKDSEANTMETVQSIQHTIVAVQKAKECYHARCFELEKLKRENAAQKDLEKAETKHKKANDEYRALLEKYENVRNDFQSKMTESCKNFQQLEEQHLSQLREFVETYAKAWENQMALLKLAHSEFYLNCNDLTVDKLIATFVHTKRTGSERPGPIEFVEADLTKLPAAPVTSEVEKREIPLLEKPKKEGAGFLSKRKKDKKKKKKEKDNISDDSGGSGKKVPVVDEEGFSVRPGRMRSPSSYEDTNNWYSSSESDSDSEDRRKIKVEIKPFSPNGTAPPDNVDVIRKTIEGLRLSPTTVKRQTPTMELNNMKRSVSVSETMSATRPSQDLLGLDLFGLSSGGASTSQLPRVTPASNSPSFIAGKLHLTNRPGTATDLLTGSSEPMYLDTGRQRSQTPTGTSLLPSAAPRTSQRNNFTSTTWRDRQSPISMERTDSVPSVNSGVITSSSPYSRGPSPLTIGVADSIPLAVAFSETTNAYFRGTDHTRCRVKTTGDMMVSFPAGIVRALIDNQCPATLSFRVKNTASFEHILLNKQLLSEDPSQGSVDCKVYLFDMHALVDHLKRQADQNKSASYFNVDILKYQLCTPADGSQATPLLLASYWKCEEGETELRIDYTYNPAAMTSCTKVPLTALTVSVPVDGGATNLHAVPPATWCEDKQRVVWRLADVSSQDNDSGCLRAKMDISNGPSHPSMAAVQFKGEGATLSGVDFELVGTGYRTSLIKKRFITGKYVSEVDGDPPA